MPQTPITNKPSVKFQSKTIDHNSHNLQNAFNITKIIQKFLTVAGRFKSCFERKTFPMHSMLLALNAVVTQNPFFLKINRANDQPTDPITGLSERR